MLLDDGDLTFVSSEKSQNEFHIFFQSKKSRQILDRSSEQLRGIDLKDISKKIISKPLALKFPRLLDFKLGDMPMLHL